MVETLLHCLIAFRDGVHLIEFCFLFCISRNRSGTRWSPPSSPASLHPGDDHGFTTAVAWILGITTAGWCFHSTCGVVLDLKLGICWSEDGVFTSSSQTENRDRDFEQSGTWLLLRSQDNLHRRNLPKTSWGYGAQHGDECMVRLESKMHHSGAEVSRAHSLAGSWRMNLIPSEANILWSIYTAYTGLLSFTTTSKAPSFRWCLLLVGLQAIQAMHENREWEHVQVAERKGQQECQIDLTIPIQFP